MKFFWFFAYAFPNTSPPNISSAGQILIDFEYDSISIPSNLARLLSIAADNLHLVSLDGAGVVQLKVDVFDQKRPDFIAEAVRVQVTLRAIDACVSWEISIS
jgi:hypothetical protein